MMNPKLVILLKEKRGNELNLELDPDHPEQYLIPKKLWEMCMKGES